jgi:hypothetical protein
VVGRLDNGEAVQVDEVHGNYSSQAAATEAARKYSAAHGGENAAVIRHTELQWIGGGDIPHILPAGASKEELLASGWRPVTSYAVVTLDPSVSATHAGQLSDVGRGGRSVGGSRIVGVGSDQDWAKVKYRHFDQPHIWPYPNPPTKPQTPPTKPIPRPFPERV